MSDIEETSTVIGLGFGNTTSAISYTNREGKAECIANEEGNRSIPSALSYVGGDEYHGDQAAAQLVRNPKNTVTCFRDFIGKDFSQVDPRSCALSAHPVEKDGEAAFKLSIATSPEDSSPKDQIMTVAEITARHLIKVRDSAADFLGKSISGVVVTVPTDFSDKQRATLEKIAKDAGVQILQIIHEPVSAILAYAALDHASGVEMKDRNVVVADVGGTRTDVSVVSIRGGLFTILATAHDYSLGGSMLDDVLVEHFGKEFQKKHKVDITGNTRALAKMKAQCETTKKTLSASSSATVSVESLAEGLDFHSSINRIRFETLGRKVFGQIADLIDSTIKKAELENFDINEVLLVGGTCHIPKLASNISYNFPEFTKIRSPTTTSPSLNPSELSSLGAAVQASLIADYEEDEVIEGTQAIITSAPHLATPIGVKSGSDFITVLDVYTPLPSRRSIEIPYSSKIEIFEGKLDVKVTTLPAPEPDSEDEDDEPAEPQTEKSRIVVPGQKLAEVEVQGGSGKTVTVMVQVDVESKVTVSARSN
ncbi:Heat shock protein 70 homolog C57A7.12 [Taphrina deformans PYCC 5710]|uniref:Heat shock protein 70 homolog C57A7.12 n=1 Tax=Taphrina deformans (strain PYCC 5710 / ATCC 11124 / CBS 356.35 / IMI 108563 / JCM 9778 / NBRC 8474) TaxID=1097556 RepID=R4X9W8_TAPDE|nr:Heat shock protein 70 homolog C57A7.12 [Taphrina deformans PYCC 5710]|eukprot:CCG82562.1 Heat shock protein 70 homolog C57A7.12 [Taphrina deformans PYCC 5710]